ncbi:MAG TPA: sigma 54-interacting transcriptional regulator [Polyangiaceae bacterium]|nr:sigma 54-interacting transcriptional regulator [Polyangiaceae bacterium]
MAHVELEVVSGAGQGLKLSSDADVIQVGRDASNDLVLEDARIAPRLLRLWSAGLDEVVLELLDGTVHVQLVRNGQTSALSADARVPLRSGDEFDLAAPGASVARLRVTIEAERDAGQLLALKPLAELVQAAQVATATGHLRPLLEALRSIGSAEDLEQAAGAVAEAALELVPRATHAAVLLRDDSVPAAHAITHGLGLIATRFRDESAEIVAPEEPFPVPRSIPRKVLRERAAVVVANAPAEAMSSESLLGASIHSTMGVPLWKRDEILGVLQVDSRDAPALFGADDVDLLGVLSVNASLAIANASLIRKLSLAEQNLRRENSFLKGRERARSTRVDLVGKSRVMQGLLAQLDKVRDTRVSVLIQGETGTGKELIAALLHHRSRRREHLFVAQNCAAFPENLLESELFGHRRGAFTGATEDKKGLFEIADGGTLFLDEIGEMPLALQAKLLRALQEGEIRPLGATSAKQVDVRIVAATNRDLDAEVKAGRFREDLLYRLKVFPIRVPPLRERREDVPLLAQHFLERYTVEFGKNIGGFEPEALHTLSAYDWPGNVRELENEVQRLVIQAEPDDRIGPQLLSPRIRQSEELVLGAAQAKGTLRAMVDQVERQILLETLREHNNNKTATARTLGITREGLHKKLKQLGIG